MRNERTHGNAPARSGLEGVSSLSSPGGKSGYRYSLGFLDRCEKRLNAIAGCTSSFRTGSSTFLRWRSVYASRHSLWCLAAIFYRPRGLRFGFHPFRSIFPWPRCLDARRCQLDTAAWAAPLMWFRAGELQVHLVIQVDHSQST